MPVQDKALVKRRWHHSPGFWSAGVSRGWLPLFLQATHSLSLTRIRQFSAAFPLEERSAARNGRAQIFALLFIFRNAITSRLLSPVSYFPRVNICHEGPEGVTLGHYSYLSPLSQPSQPRVPPGSAPAHPANPARPIPISHYAPLTAAPPGRRALRPRRTHPPAPEIK